MTDNQSVVFYLALFLFTSLICKMLQPAIEACINNNRHIKLLCLFIIASLPLVIVAAVRDISVGVDSLTYYNSYLMASKLSLNQIFIENNEGFLYNILLYWTSHATNNPAFFFGILQAMTVIPIMWFGAKKNEYIEVWQIVLIYCLWHYNDSLNAVRQMIAVSLLLLAFAYYCDKKLFKTIIVFIIALGFHSSVILVGPAILIVQLAVKKDYGNIKKIFIIGIVVVALLYGQNLFIQLVSLGVLPARYSFYINTFFYGTSRTSSQWLSVGLGGVFESLIRTMILVWCLRFLKKSNDISIDRYTLLFAINIVIYTAGLIVYKTSYFVRLSLYFDAFGMYLMSYLDVNGGLKIRVDKRRVYLFTIIISLAYWFIHILVLKQSGSIPYIFSTFS